MRLAVREGMLYSNQQPATIFRGVSVLSRSPLFGAMAKVLQVVQTDEDRFVQGWGLVGQTI